jgi:TetR/AcrR family transcriptional repressor of mexCD-oprJ operon
MCDIHDSRATNLSHLRYYQVMPEDSPNPSPADDRREAMLRAAAGYLSRRPNANLAEVATAAGISRATLHRHFAGKSALVGALLERAEQSLREAATRADLERGDHHEALRRLIREFDACAPFIAMLYTFSKEGDDDTVSAAWEAADRMIVAFFEDGQRAHRFSPSIPATWMAEAFYALNEAGEWAVASGRTARRDTPALIHRLLLDGVGLHEGP